MALTPGRLIYTVSDNGIGMAPHVIDHIFDMFAQAERTSDRTQGGLGIGLALVKNLVQLHGGTVAAYSDGAGAGSRFEIGFPLSAQPLAPADAASAGDGGAAPARSVLVVDDNVDAAMMLGMFLELAGYTVQIVHDATAALAVATTAPHAIDACLLDIGLPDMDGNALARRLRGIDATANATLIAITGYGQEDDRRKTREAGFDQHHVKPVDMQKLMDTLAALP
jgi:CheY-like chemotaxis protein